MKLRSVHQQYEFSDESGYRFVVDAVKDPEFGWSASVSMSTNGFKTPEDAIRHLLHSTRAFERQVKETLGDAD